MTTSKTYNRSYWQSEQSKRTVWERKFAGVFYKTLNKQYRDLASQINIGAMSEGMVNLIEEKPVYDTMLLLFNTVGVVYAKETYRGLKTLKDDEALLIDTWYKAFQSYLRGSAGYKIVSIVKESRKQALKVIRSVIEEYSMQGADVVVREMRKGLITEGIKINKWRALRIARTEVVDAANLGAFQGAADSGLALNKVWIPTYKKDSRDHHQALEGIEKPMNEPFIISGIYEAQRPHDPNLPAGEVINCGCQLAFKPISFANVFEMDLTI